MRNESYVCLIWGGSSTGWWAGKALISLFPETRKKRSDWAKSTAGHWNMSSTLVSTLEQGTTIYTSAEFQCFWCFLWFLGKRLSIRALEIVIVLEKVNSHKSKEKSKMGFYLRWKWSCLGEERYIESFLVPIADECIWRVGALSPQPADLWRGIAMTAVVSR